MAHIDYLSFVVNVSRFEDDAETGEFRPDEIYKNINHSLVCMNYESFYSHDFSGRFYLSIALLILESSVTDNVVVKSRRSGMFGYHNSYAIYNERGENLGVIAFGGNSGGLYISLTGQGCQVFNNNAFYNYINAYDINIKITRVDIAHDFFYSEYTVEYATRAYKNGEFGTGGRKPSAKLIDDLENDTGKTLYVGKSQNGKMLRCYEKGKQLKNKKSKWVRYELVLTARDRVIPVDILRDDNLPRYFSGGYDFLGRLDLGDNSVEQEKIKTLRRKSLRTIAHLIKYAKLSYGKLLTTLKNEFNLLDSQIMTVLQRDGVVVTRPDFEIVGV